MIEDINAPTCDIVCVLGCSNEVVSMFLKHLMEKDDEISRHLDEICNTLALMSTLPQNISGLIYSILYRASFNTWIHYALREDGEFTSNCDCDNHFECGNTFWHDQQTHVLVCTVPFFMLCCFWLELRIELRIELSLFAVACEGYVLDLSWNDIGSTLIL